MSKTPKNTQVPTFIYTLSDPETKEIRYIGKTVKKLKTRLSDHLYSAKQGNNHRINWIKSIVNRKLIPEIDIIEVIPWDESQECEIYWIAQFKAWGFRLVNLTIGGEGCINRKLSKETIEKIRLGNGKKVYQYDKNGNYIRSFDSCKEAGKSINKGNSKIASCAKGNRRLAYNYQWSYVKHNKLDKYERNCYIPTKEDLQKRKKRFSKPVLQYDLEGNFIKEWESAKIAAEKLNLCYICIIEYLNGKRINHYSINKLGGFVWKRK
jgi:hypothetical protein